MQRVVIYGRVSTQDQTCENQVQFLKQIIEQNNWELIDTYLDHGISGTKGRTKRPEFDRLCKDMVRQKFDKVMVWDISRLGRSLQHLVEFLNEAMAVNCDMYIHQSGLDTSTPSGRMLFQVVGVFSEFEREMISERVKLGLQRLKSSGKKLGRPKRINANIETEVMKLSAEGKSLTSIAKALSISKTSTYRIIHSQ